MCLGLVSFLGVVRSYSGKEGVWFNDEVLIAAVKNNLKYRTLKRLKTTSIWFNTGKQ